MQHLDEGTVNAWLDGELPFDESQRVVAHAETCDQCTAMITQARGYVAAAARILRNLDEIPAGVIPPEVVAPEQIEKPKTPLDDWGVVLPLPRKNNPRRWIPSRFAAAAAVTVLAVGTYAILNRSDNAATADLSARDVAESQQMMDSVAAVEMTLRQAEAKSQAAPAAAAPVVATVPADVRNASARTGEREQVTPGRQNTAPPPAAPPAPDARGFASAAASRERTTTDTALAKTTARVDAESTAARDVAANRVAGADSQRLAARAESVVALERRRLVGEVDAQRRLPVVTTGTALAAEPRPATNPTITTAPGCYDLQRGPEAVQEGVPAGIRLADIPVRVGTRTLRVAIPDGGAGEGVRWYWSLSGSRIMLHKVVGGSVQYEAPVTAVRRGC
jgi:hypothetical protein